MCVYIYICIYIYIYTYRYKEKRYIYIFSLSYTHTGRSYAHIHAHTYRQAGYLPPPRSIWWTDAPTPSRGRPTRFTKFRPSLDSAQYFFFNRRGTAAEDDIATARFRGMELNTRQRCINCTFFFIYSARPKHSKQQYKSRTMKWRHLVFREFLFSRTFYTIRKIAGSKGLSLDLSQA